MIAYLFDNEATFERLCWWGIGAVCPQTYICYRFDADKADLADLNIKNPLNLRLKNNQKKAATEFSDRLGGDKRMGGLGMNIRMSSFVLK